MRAESEVGELLWFKSTQVLGITQRRQYQQKKQLAHGLDSQGHQIEPHSKQNQLPADGSEQQILDPQ